MDIVTKLGFLAAILSTSAFIPQVYKVVKTKNTTDISLGMYIIFIAGIGCWLVYSFLIFNIPMISANIATIILAGIVMFYKIKYG